MKKFVRLCALFALAACATTLHAAIITVNSTNNSDFSVGVTNLFYALSLANTNGDSSNTIKFNIPGTGAHYLKTPTNGYPLITNHNLTIDGYSQPGSAPNSNPILAPNNAQIKIVLDSRIDPASTDFLGTDMNYAPGAGNTGFGAGDVGILGLFRATNFLAQGLCFLGQFSPNYDMYCVAIACDLQGTSHHARVSGCWFGLDLDGTSVVGGCVQAIDNARHRDNPAKRQATSDFMTVGVKAGSANPRAEFNVMLGMIETIGIEGNNARISGNFIGVFPDGLHDYIGPRDGPDIGDNWDETHIEIGRANNNTVIGSDLDGVNDADERNIIGGVVDQSFWVAATSRPRGYTHVIEFYGNNTVINGTNYGPGTNIIVAGNYFGVGIDGSTRFTTGVPALDGTSSQVRFENNVVFNNYPTNIFDPALAATRGFFDGINAGNIISARGNKLVNNYPFPTHPQKSGGFFTNYYNKALLVPTDANSDVYPVLSTKTTLLRLAGTVPIANTNYPTTIIDLYIPDPEGITNGMVAMDPDLPDGWVQGLTYLGSFVEGSTNDLNPAPGQFEFDISKFDLKGATQLTITANYSKSPSATPNAVILTSPFAAPYTLPPFIPGGTASVGLTHTVPDVLLWYNSTGNYYTNGPVDPSAQLANLGNWEPNISVLGDTTFLIGASTFADDQTVPPGATYTGPAQRFVVTFQPANGGPAKIGEEFHTDAGSPFRGVINLSRENGNPQRVAGDKRPGATKFITAAETSAGQIAAFQGNSRWTGNGIYAADDRYGTVQTYSLDTATLAQTPLTRAFDAINGRKTGAFTGNKPEVSRFGGEVAALDDGNFVVVVDDRSNYSSTNRTATVVIISPDGAIVKETYAVDASINNQIWSNVAAYKGGFCIRFNATLYFYDNAGNLLGSSPQSSSGLPFDLGRGDGTRIASDIRSYYVYLAGRTPDAAHGTVSVAVWDSRTRNFLTSATVSDTDPTVHVADRVNIAVDALDRVCVAYTVRPTTDFTQNQIAARVLKFDGSTNVTYLTHSFFPFVNYDPDGSLNLLTSNPSVAMTTRQICIAAKGTVNSTNTPAGGPNTSAETTLYTVVSHPDPQPTPGGGPLIFTNVTAAAAGSLVTLSWSGGTAPYLIQKKSSLDDATWQNVLTTTRQTESVALQGGAAFFRISDNATNTVIPLTAFLNGDGERPQVTTSATGLGSFTLEGNTLTYTITFSGLSAPATAAHIHGPTNTTGSIGVIVPFANVPSATAGTISGTTTVSDAIKGYLLSGLTYANIHNTNHTGGEIRGQIGPTQLKASLSSDAERPTPIVTAGTGSGTLTRIGNQLLFNVTYSGLTSAASAAHIHGRADTSQFAGVLMPLPTPSGTAGVISGLLTLDNPTLSAIVDGLSYVNIHTLNNQGGEIRGQITP